jgi:hypothetical protein
MNNIKKLAYYAVPTILGSAVISSLYHQYNDKSQSFAEHLKENVNWIFDRVPNARENFILAAPMGIFNFLFEPYVDVLYQRNPVSKTVIRNAFGIATTSLNWKLDVGISNTGVKYDVGHVAGNVGALLCKGGIIALSYQGNNAPGALETASLLSNLICEPIIRTQNLVSQHRQEQNLTLPFQDLPSITAEINDYKEFAKNHLIENPNVVMQGVGEGLFKAVVSTVVGGVLFGTFGISRMMRDTYVGAENGFLGYFGAAGGDSFAQRLASVGPLQCNFAKKMGIYATLAIIDVSFKVSVEVITGFLIIPGIRAAQDFIGIKIDNYLNPNEETETLVDCSSIPYDAEGASELSINSSGHQPHDEL